jgi:hypothetical protein
MKTYSEDVASDAVVLTYGVCASFLSSVFAGSI